jgi:serine/threonine protein kinase
MLDNEINIMRSLDSINLVKLYESYRTANNFYLITELCDKLTLGDLMK